LIANITYNLPEIGLPVNEPVSIRVATGDAFSYTLAHIGTDRGVFRDSAACGNCSWNWKPYNEGLPLAIVNNLIVVPATGELRAATRGRGLWTTATGPSTRARLRTRRADRTAVRDGGNASDRQSTARNASTDSKVSLKIGRDTALFVLERRQ
jgi:hypothetical protein